MARSALYRFLFSVVFTAALVVGAATSQAAELPNLIVIVADDLGYGDLGSYGGQAIATPNIDSLATDGVRFTDFHASDSVCTPSRAGLLTGRYAKRMGLDVPLHPAEMGWSEWLMVRFGYAMGRLGLMDLATEGGVSGLQEDEITIAEALKAAGYATAMVGKWHLGDYVGDPRHDPRRHGFDHYLGVPYSNDMVPFPLVRDGEVLEANIEDQSKLTRVYTDDAIEFIEKTNRTKPFFLYFAHTFPHRPLFASKEGTGRSQAGLYGDVVEEIDASVGALLSALDREGLRDNTLVLFTSDNGPWYQGSSGGLRGRKGQSYEGGFRVPLLGRWPARIPRGLVAHAPAMNIDLFPTLLAAAGVSLPDDREIDGRDLTAVLTTPDAPSPHTTLYFYHQGTLEGVRDGDWKYFRSLHHYVWPNPLNRVSGRLSPHTTGPLPLLYDLRIDRDESYDLSGKYPEVAARMASQLEAFERSLQDNRKGWKR